VDVVDERFFWRDDTLSTMNLNQSTNDKSKLFDSTEWDDDDDPGTEPVPWNVGSAVRHLRESLSTDPAEWADTSDLDAFGFRDITANCLNVAEVVDKLLSHAGYFLAAFPNTTYSGISGNPRYAVGRIGDGEAAASSVLTVSSDFILSGGIYTPSPAFDPPVSGAGAKAYGSVAAWLNVEVPSMLKVAFPVAAEKTTQYVTGQEDDSGPGVHHATDRFYTVDSTAGRPGPGNNQTMCVFDTFWAIRQATDTDPINLVELQVRADEVATRYYDRYRSGAGHILLRGTVPIIPYAGAQTITWGIEPIGPVTRLDGEVDCPLFGFRVDTALTAQDIYSTGRIRSIPRPDGGILLDVIPETIRLYYGQVTQAYSPVNSNYDAEAYDDATVAVVNAIPIRTDNIGFVDMPAVAPGSPCWLGVRPSGTIDLYVPEVRPVVLCPDQNVAQATQTDLRILAKHGRLNVAT
jgi:hypothetical protein